MILPLNLFISAITLTILLCDLYILTYVIFSYLKIRKDKVSCVVATIEAITLNDYYLDLDYGLFARTEEDEKGLMEYVV